MSGATAAAFAGAEVGEGYRVKLALTEENLRTGQDLREFNEGQGYNINSYLDAATVVATAHAQEHGQEGHAATVVAFWNLVKENCHKFGVEILTGDFNMSFTATSSHGHGVLGVEVETWDAIQAALMQPRTWRTACTIRP